MRIKKIIINSMGLLAFGAAASVYASGPGFYIGAEAGKTWQHNKKQTVAVDDPFPIGGTITLSPANTGAGGRLFAGYNVTNYWGLEGGFTHYAPSTYTIPPGTNVTVGNSQGKPAITANGFDFEAKGMVPVWNFSLFGKLGFAVIRASKAGTFTDTYDPVLGTYTTVAGTTTYFRPLVGGGLSYNFNQNWEAQFSATRVVGGGGLQALDLVSLGFSYHFVDKYCGQFLC